MNWYCEECREFVLGLVLSTTPCVENHKEKIVGIRSDILKDSLSRLVKDLRRTDRLVPYGGRV